VIALQVLLAPGGGLEGQSHHTDPHSIRWWEVAITAGAIAGATLFDRGVDDWMQNQRTSGSNAVARAFRHGGQPEVYVTVGGGLLLAGVAAERADLRRRGGRVLLSVAAAGLTTAAIKELGRVRPAETRNVYVFRPFSRHESFPSGHTTIAFAFATSLSEEIDRPWATVLLYAGAAGTGWSRMNDQRHWLSDVLAGAAVGITAGKIVEGRWRLFGLGPPRILIDPAGESRLEWRVSF
jgi:membrane-associated phospholipid phosphatase